MKINNINFNQHTNIKKISTNNNSLKNFFNNPFLDNKKDVFEISFKSKEQKPSDLFLKTINKKDFQEKIIKKILTDNNGNYKPEIENIFLNIYATLINDISTQGQLTPELCEKVIEGIIIALEAIKNENGKFQFEGNDVVYLSMAATDALINNIDDIEGILETSKEENGCIDETLVDIMMLTRSSDPNLSNQEIIHCISRYFTDKNNKIFIGNIPIIMNYFNIAKAQTIIEKDLFFSLISDGNPEEFNSKKCDFACGAIEDIYNIFAKELNPYSFEKEKLFIQKITYVIIDKIINLNTDKNGEFNTEKAMKSYQDWIESAKQVNFLYQKEGLEKIQLSPLETQTENKEKHILNSTPYKLFRLLYL